MVFSISGEFSTEHPQMIRARFEIFPPTSAAAFSASLTVIVGPPITRTSAPVASLSSTEPSSGLVSASVTASVTRSVAL